MKPSMKPSMKEEERESELQSLKNGASFGLMSLDKTGKCTYVNQAWQNIFGMNSDEADQYGWLQKIHPEDWKKIECPLLTSSPSLRKSNFPCRIFDRNGEIRFCLLEFIPVFDQKQGSIESFFAVLHDFTSHFHSQKRFENFFISAPQLLATANLQGYLTEVNPRFEELLGYDEKTLLSKRFIELIHPQDRALALKMIERLGKEKLIKNVEVRLVTQGGAARFFVFNATLSMEESRIYINAHDITENRLSERSLKLQNDLISTMNKHDSLEEAADDLLAIIVKAFDWSLGLLWLIEPRKKRLFVANAYCATQSQKEKDYLEISRRFSLSDGECLPGRVWGNKSPINVTHFGQEHGFSRAPYAIQAALESAVVLPIHTQNQFIGVLEFYSDKEFFSDATFHHLFYTLGNSLGEFHLRKKSEKKEYLLASIVETSMTAIYSLDIQGTILTWNHGAELLYGYLAEEIIGKSATLLSPSESPDTLRDILAKVTENKKIDNFEILQLDKEGKEIEVALSASQIVDSHEKLIGFSTISHDISERKQLEKMKNEFISIVSHELRTPLTSITGSLKLLTTAKRGLLNPESYKLVEIAERNASRLAKLVNDILDIGKMEAGKMVFQEAPVNLVTLLQNAIETTRPFAKNLKVDLEIETQIPQAEVYADPDRLSQVITNLISNGVKFSPENGKVLLRVTKNEGQIRTECIDQGVGIPKEMAGKLFQKFSQIDSSDKRKREGTGLGLSISKMIIEKFGGKIGFDSEPGKGSTFYFDLPEYSTVKSP